MFSRCLFCHADLGSNETLPTFPVGQRLAFDAKRGRLWVICTSCNRWNLSPLDERWEAIELCERLFRGTRLRASSDNVGLSRLKTGLELVRIGSALLPEIASWRYGARLMPYESQHEPKRALIVRGTQLLVRTAASALVGYATSAGLSDEALLKVRTFRREHRVLARLGDAEGRSFVLRYGHLRHATLVRPDRDTPWQLRVTHDGGHSTLAQSAGLRTAGKLLATLNFGAASAFEVQHAIAKLDDAGDPEGFFTRITSLAMRTSWGRFPNARLDQEQQAAAHKAASLPERLALQLAGRSFWGRGSTGSEEATPLYRLPAVDRLALEMASNENIERAAMQGELDDLHAAWKDAEEIAAIADDMFVDDVFEEAKRRYATMIAMWDSAAALEERR